MNAVKEGQCAAKNGSSTGKGSYCSVYKGRMDDTITAKGPVTVAVKEYQLPMQKNDDEAASLTEENISFFVDDMREMLIPLAPHPNVCHYYGIELIPGMLQGNLDRVLLTSDWVEHDGKKIKGPLPEPEVRHIARGIFRALNHIHAAGLTHDDLRPCNIIYSNAWDHCDCSADEKAKGFKHPVLVDYSIFKKIQNILDPLGGNATTKQTPAYCAPEIFTDGKDYDSTKTDVWSLAASLLEILSGKAPWHEMDPSGKGNIMFKIIQARNPPKYPAGITEECKGFFDTCFNRDHGSRPTAEEALEHPWLNV